MWAWLTEDVKKEIERFNCPDYLKLLQEAADERERIGRKLAGE
jgi:hypothetical protein